MSEILCHDIAKLRDPLLFSEEARLVTKGRPSKAFKSMVLQAFGLTNVDNIYSCSQAHMKPAGVCNKGDLVFLHGHRGQNLQVCQIWMHVEIDSTMFSLVSKWDLVEMNLHGGFATVRKKDDAIFVSTADLACTTSHCHFEKDLYNVIVPLQVR